MADLIPLFSSPIITEFLNVDTSQLQKEEEIFHKVKSPRLSTPLLSISEDVRILKKYPYLRSEFVQDISPFCLTPHTDETIKACTILIYLSKDMDSESMGTELYENEDMSGLTVKAPFISNTGYIFLPDGKTTWHGIKEVKFEGVRKVLIINYVGPGWRDTHQLYNS